MTESQAREHMTLLGRSMFERGLAFGSAGNLSMKVDDGVLITPTNVCLGRLDPARISKVDETGRHVSGDKPSKENFLHLNMYRERPGAGAVVHLHSTHSVAVSVLDGLPDVDPIPPITAYYVMKIGKLVLLPYFPPGDPELANAVKAVAGRHHAILLANHGPVIAGSDLDAAVYATEELEETAKLFLMLRGEKLRLLSRTDVEELERRFPG